MRPVLLVCAFSILLAAGTRAEADDLEAKRAALAAEAAAKLEALADWCRKERIFGCRDVAYEALLEFSPDHEKARKKLKYKRGEDGAWVQNPRYKRATNWKPKLIPESEERLAKIRDEHLAGLLDLYVGAKTIPGLLEARRRVEALQSRHPGAKRPRELLRTLMLRYYRLVREKGVVEEMEDARTFFCAHYPQDLEIRAALGEVRHDGVWVLTESARTLERRGKLAEAAKAALAAAETKAVALESDEAAIELPWKTGVGTKQMRVVGTAEEDVLKRVARYTQAAGSVFEAALGTRPVRRKGLTLVVLAGEGEDDTFIDNYPVVDNPSLRQRKKIGLDLVYLHGEGMLLRKNPPDAQLDLAVNTVLNQLFSDTFLGHDSPRGWHAEGISRYLSYTLLGTRLSINVVGRYAGQGGDRHVPESRDSWLGSAQAQLKKNKDVGLQIMLGKGVDTFNVRDAVLSYAFAVYLLEGHEGAAAPFVKEHAENSDVDRTCRDLLDMPRTVVEHRLARWLDEVAAALAPAQEPVAKAPPEEGPTGAKPPK